MVYLNDHIEDIDVTDALSRVGPQRAKYALRYRRELDQRLSLAAFLLLQQALRTEYGLQEIPEFTFGTHGKPMLKEHPEIHFNLSHCSQAALCVVSSQPVGCDVESVPDELDMDVCRHCFNEAEINHILHSDHPTLAFTTLWTKKEAFLKLTGEGLTNNLHRLLDTAETKGVTFQTTAIHSKGYVYTVCRTLNPWKIDSDLLRKQH